MNHMFHDSRHSLFHKEVINLALSTSLLGKTDNGTSDNTKLFYFHKEVYYNNKH